ncbi:hypothetical protein R3P38DRAFT_3293653 [Favolaschia claudopus]|uniref:Uncharacterized protein n=1 Tax=Favolaschia claudopus TaxID=2862362 RepID=A0AAV9ZHH9_9AGAR
MSSSLSASATSSSASATSSSFPPFPSGCAGRPGFVTGSGNFYGCVAEDPDTILRTCCDTVGSTATFANTTCGCPYNNVFTADRFMQFANCATEHNKTSLCLNAPKNDTDKGAALDLRPRWNSAVIVLGVALVCGAVGM